NRPRRNVIFVAITISHRVDIFPRPDYPGSLCILGGSDPMPLISKRVFAKSIHGDVDLCFIISAEPPAVEWISKRQHPGKRLLDEMEKRQHPGKREEGDWYLDLPKRQHPGRRSSLADQYPQDSPSSALGLLTDVSKRQHPGKRIPSYTKRQHPGKRGYEEEEVIELVDPHEVEKRQHPGKRYLETDDADYVPPCDGPDPFNCSKGGFLLDLLDNVNRARVEEKRQHPGRRALWEGEVPLAQE
uniref:Thyrotropin releasing hormone n=1 Tax=Leptobrachium leishanense TaxID=445787 RepID=A0A8C5MG74_9ANUR